MDIDLIISGNWVTDRRGLNRYPVIGTRIYISVRIPTLISK